MAPIGQECDVRCSLLSGHNKNEIGKRKEEKGKGEERSLCHERRILMNQFPLLSAAAALQRSEMAIFRPTSIGKREEEEGERKAVF